MFLHFQLFRGLSVAAAIGMSLLHTSCKNQSAFIAPKDDKGKKDEKKNENSSADDERVDIPGNIVGSYLVCSLRKSATSTDLASDYGCRLNEASTDKKLDISSALASVLWGSNISANVSINQRSPIEAWHAIYTVSGPTLESIQETVSRLNVQVQWTGAAKNSVIFKNQPIIDVLRPLTSTGDTTAPILQQGIDPKDPGL